jgi:hypothetical protein
MGLHRHPANAVLLRHQRRVEVELPLLVNRKQEFVELMLR